jgi:hypothetical protein
MNCQHAQDWLLQADHPRQLEEAPADVSGHVRTCADCQRLADRLERLEERWREEPVPASAERVRDDFLLRLPSGAAPATLPLRQRRFLTRPRWLLAATVLLALLAGSWLLMPAPQVRANSDLVDRLLDWNEQISEAQTPAERARLHAEQVEQLKADLQKPGLSEGDRALAEKLLETADWLTKHTDPVEEAERFNALADQVLDRLHAATRRGDEKAMERMARHYRRIAEHGIEGNLERAHSAPAPDPERNKRLERLLQRDAQRLKNLDAILEQMPDASRKEIRKALHQQKRHEKQSQKKDRNQRLSYRARSAG